MDRSRQASVRKGDGVDQQTQQAHNTQALDMKPQCVSANTASAGEELKEKGMRTVGR